jgi:hypothetical protein
MVYEMKSTTANENSSSPLIQSTNESTDEIYQNIIHIQKNIKGRAIQNLLVRGVKKFRDVIEEAKETHSIAAIRKLFPKEFSQNIDNHQHIFHEYKRIEEALKNDVKLQEELKKVESRDVGNLLNFLERELQRLDGEKRSHALYLLAERERYRRQAAMMGKMGEFDEQFENDAITLYLENILMEGIQRASNEDDTRHYIREVAKKIDRRANKNVTFHDEAEEFSYESNTESVSNNSEGINEIPDQKVVVEMLKENMMPQILNRIKSEQLIMKQRKYLSAAHQTLFREEYERKRREEDKQLCFEIFDEMFDFATLDDKKSSSHHDESSEISETSREADELAGEIVRNILNEMIDGNFNFSSTAESSFSGDSYDGDYSNVQSTDGDSTAEVLAHQVVQSVLDEILNQSFTSSPESNESASSDNND